MRSAITIVFSSAAVINWEIWINTGKSALPRRLAVTYKDHPNFPRFLVEFSDWNLKPKLTTSRFVFKKPSNAKQIEFDARAGPKTE